jgi:hypothetical protein
MGMCCYGILVNALFLGYAVQRSCCYRTIFFGKILIGVLRTPKKIQYNRTFAPAQVYSTQVDSKSVPVVRTEEIVMAQPMFFPFLL